MNVFKDFSASKDCWYSASLARPICEASRSVGVGPRSLDSVGCRGGLLLSFVGVDGAGDIRVGGGSGGVGSSYIGFRWSR